MKLASFAVGLLVLAPALAATGMAHVAPLPCPSNRVVTSVDGGVYIVTYGPPTNPVNLVNGWWYVESGAEAGLQSGDPDGNGLQGPIPEAPLHDHRCQALAHWDYQLY